MAKQTSGQRITELRQALAQAENAGNDDDVILYTGQIAALDRMLQIERRKAAEAEASEKAKATQALKAEWVAHERQARECWIDTIKQAIALANRAAAIHEETKALAKRIRLATGDQFVGSPDSDRLLQFSQETLKFLHGQYMAAEIRKDDAFSKAGIDSRDLKEPPSIPVTPPPVVKPKSQAEIQKEIDRKYPRVYNDN